MLAGWIPGLTVNRKTKRKALAHPGFHMGCGVRHQTSVWPGSSWCALSLGAGLGAQADRMSFLCPFMTHCSAEHPRLPLTFKQKSAAVIQMNADFNSCCTSWSTGMKTSLNLILPFLQQLEIYSSHWKKGMKASGITRAICLKNAALVPRALLHKVEGRFRIYLLIKVLEKQVH